MVSFTRLGVLISKTHLFLTVKKRNNWLSKLVSSADKYSNPINYNNFKVVGDIIIPQPIAIVKKT